VTKPWAEQPRNRGSIVHSGKGFLSSQNCSGRLWGPYKLLLNDNQGITCLPKYENRIVSQINDLKNGGSPETTNKIKHVVLKHFTLYLGLWEGSSITQISLHFIFSFFLSLFIYYFLLGRTSATYVGAEYYCCTYHTHWHTHILGRTPLDEGSAHHTNLYLTTHSTPQQPDIHALGGIIYRILYQVQCRD